MTIGCNNGKELEANWGNWGVSPVAGNLRNNEKELEAWHLRRCSNGKVLDVGVGVF